MITCNRCNKATRIEGSLCDECTAYFDDNKESFVVFSILTSATSIYSSLEKTDTQKIFELMCFVSFLILTEPSYQFKLNDPKELGNEIIPLEVSLIMTDSSDNKNYIRDLIFNRARLYANSKPEKWVMLMTNMMKSSIYHGNPIILNDTNILEGVFSVSIPDRLELPLVNGAWMKNVIPLVSNVMKSGSPYINNQGSNKSCSNSIGCLLILGSIVVIIIYVCFQQ